MEKRFNDCGLLYLQPSEGVLIEFTPEEVSRGRQRVIGKTPLSSYLLADVLSNAIHNIMEKSPEFARYSFAKFDLFHFRPKTYFTEVESGAIYEVFQVPLRESGGDKYAYVIIDKILPRTDEGDNIIVGRYRLRGISKLMPNAVPEYGWCNSDENWIYWSNESTDFNKGVTAIS